MAYAILTDLAHNAVAIAFWVSLGVYGARRINRSSY
jgi:hypothetical protein